MKMLQISLKNIIYNGKGRNIDSRFPSRKGKEQMGTRPAIVIADTKTDLALLIPLTSNLESMRKLPFTVEIKKSNDNKLEKDSVALVFQIQAIDKKRILSKIGNIEDYYLEKIDRTIKELLKI